ncbi:MAG: aminoglycoside 6-adenylyltransferase [Thermoplasmata archaeon]|jgi:aminoglycoside 6-adenylyltransferase
MMSPPSALWILRLQDWAEKEPNIRLALLVGSQARTQLPADPYSDIDIALFVRDPVRILRDEEWIGDLGPYWTSHVEATPIGSVQERRVLFHDGQDIDFAVFPVQSLMGLLSDAQGASVLRRGFRALVNKDSAELSVPSAEPPPVPPSSLDFSNLVNDFWFHLVWTAKKLRRGELLVASEATNGYLRALLVRTVRWHALVRGSPGRDLWHGARFFESWADPRVIRDFPETVAQYDTRSIAKALSASRTMFCWLSDELSESLSFTPPIRDRASLSSYLDGLLGNARP